MFRAAGSTKTKLMRMLREIGFQGFIILQERGGPQGPGNGDEEEAASGN